MAVNNLSELDQTIETMIAPQESRMAAVGAALNGAGPEASAAFKALREFASGMRLEGESAASDIAAIRADENIPHDERHLHRIAEEKRRTDANAVLQKFNALGQEHVGKLEGALVANLLPRPATDAAQRLLTRDGLRTRYARHTDPEKLLSTLQRRIGEDAGHDSELLSTYGADVLEGAGLTPDQVDGLKAHAIEVYLKRNDGSATQRAARNALTVFRASNLAGAVAGFHMAGRLRLDSVK
jgi:hypothetical protein